MRAASDTQRTAGARLGGPRPGRTAVGADRAGGGGGHVVPARYRPGGARRAQVELYSWVRRRGWRRCLRHRPDPAALGTGSADTRSGGLWVPEPSFCRLGRWRSCRARPPSARSCRPARPCPVGHPQGGCVATDARKVLHPAHVLACDVLGVADQQGTDSLSHRKGNHLLGSLMLSLVDAAAMTRLLTPHVEPVTPPAPRPPLAWLGCPPRSPRVAGLLVAQVQVALGPNRPARH